MKDVTESSSESKNELSREKLMRLLKLVLSTVILAGVYIFGIMMEWPIVVFVYYALLFIASIAFVIINRGLSNRSPEPDELPEDWSYVQKCEYIEKDKKRKERAKPLLYIIIPLLMIFAIDIIYMQYFSK